MTQKLADIIGENSTTNQYERLINLCCTRPAIVHLDEVSSLSSFYDKLSHSDSATLFKGNDLLGHVFDLRGIKLGFDICYHVSSGKFTANSDYVKIPVYNWNDFQLLKSYKDSCFIGKENSKKLDSQDINPYMQGRKLLPKLFFTPNNKSLSSNQ